MRSLGRRTVLLVAALAVSVSGLPAHSFDGPGCGGNWPPQSPDDRNPCTLLIAGQPITVFAETVGAKPAQNASIRVWISPPNRPEVALLECSSSGKGRQTCADGVPNESCGPPVDEDICDFQLPKQIQFYSQLQCNFEVQPAGRFFCQAGS